MPQIHICHEMLDKTVEVTDGCHLDIIQHEVLKRVVTITGLGKLKCEAYESCETGLFMLYGVEILSPTGIKLFHMWVRWYK